MEEKSDKGPSSSPSISSLTTDSETETWEVIEDKEKKCDDKEPPKQENPKITIDKPVESTYTFDEQLPLGDVKQEDNKNVCQESSLKVGKSPLFNRVEDASNENRGTYEDYSDGISVISESEIECLDGHTDEPILTDTSEDPKKELIPRSCSKVCAVQSESLPLLVCLRDFFANHQFATVAIISICVAILGGIFCQLSMMLNGSQIPSNNDLNLLICQNKMIELERDNANLRIEISILQKEIEEFQLNSGVKPSNGEQEAGQPENPLPLKREGKSKGPYKGKKIKTKYDSFKRPPVAAGGEEETIIHVDKPLIVDEEEDQMLNWNDYLEPLESIWKETKDPITDEPHDKLSEPLDLDNFEPIKVTEVETEPTTTINLNELPIKMASNEEVQVAVEAENDEDDKETEGSQDQKQNKPNKQKYEKYDKKQKDHKKSKKFDKDKQFNDKDQFEHQEKLENGSETSEKKYPKKSKEHNEKRRQDFQESNDEESKENDERLDDDEKGKKRDKKSYKKNKYNQENQYKDKEDAKQQRKYKERKDFSSEKTDDDTKDKYQRKSKYRTEVNEDSSNENVQYKNSKKERKFRERSMNDSSREHENESGEKKHDKNRKTNKKDFQKRQETGSGSPKDFESREKHDRNWHEDRMKNREKHRSEENDDNWYIERKANREKHREGREKDSNWYIERTLERELLRSREMDSKERIK